MLNLFSFDPFNIWWIRWNKYDIRDLHAMTVPMVYGLPISGKNSWTSAGFPPGKTTGTTVPASLRLPRVFIHVCFHMCTRCHFHWLHCAWLATLLIDRWCSMPHHLMMRCISRRFELCLHGFDPFMQFSEFRLWILIYLQCMRSILGSCSFVNLICILIYLPCVCSNLASCIFWFYSKFHFPHYFILFHLFCSTSKNH